MHFFDSDYIEFEARLDRVSSPLLSSSRAAERSAPARRKNKAHAWILGRRYADTKDSAWRDDVASLIWCSYRRNFEQMLPYSFTSDSGWGCMVRSAQMLMAQALRVHWLGRDWRLPAHYLGKVECERYMQILRLFTDLPGKGHLFSIHNMIKVGLASYDKLPGEWYGPSAVSYVLRDLGLIHNHTMGSGLAVMVAQNDAVVIDEVDNTCAVLRDPSSDAHDGNQRHGAGETQIHAEPQGSLDSSASSVPIVPTEEEEASAGCGDAGSEICQEASTEQAAEADQAPAGDEGEQDEDDDEYADAQGDEASDAGTAADDEPPTAGSSHQAADAHAATGPAEFFDPLLNRPPSRAAEDRGAAHGSGSGEPNEGADLERRPWSKHQSLLLLIPLRLGLDRIDPARIPWLLRLLEVPQSVGFIGGRPNHALYFTGHAEDTLFGMDPHTTQSTPSSAEHISSKAHIESMHCAKLQSMRVQRLDPSLALGFYFHDQEDFNDWCLSVSAMQEEFPGMPFVIQRRELGVAFDDDHEVGIEGDEHSRGGSQMDHAESSPGDDDDFLLV